VCVYVPTQFPDVQTTALAPRDWVHEVIMPARRLELQGDASEIRK